MRVIMVAASSCLARGGGGGLLFGLELRVRAVELEMVAEATCNMESRGVSPKPPTFCETSSLSMITRRVDAGTIEGTEAAGCTVRLVPWDEWWEW